MILNTEKVEAYHPGADWRLVTSEHDNSIGIFYQWRGKNGGDFIDFVTVEEFLVSDLKAAVEFATAKHNELSNEAKLCAAVDSLVKAMRIMFKDKFNV
jgi:hypothetical protein